jgi:ribosome maturation factor RimP
MENIEQKLREMITPLCEDSALFLINLRIHGGGKNRLVKVTVDTETGITLDECKKLTQEINDLFFRKNIFQGIYRLEVTSPGVEKPLEKPFEFKRNLGRTLEVTYHIDDESHQEEGELYRYSEDNLILKRSNGEEIRIPADKIAEARIKLKW